MKIINQETTLTPINEIQPHPQNPRQGDTGAIHTSITNNGFYGTIIAQRSTGYILAGNHRWQAAQHAGTTEIPVTWVDVNDEHALRILLTDNRTSDLATNNEHQLAKILQELHATTGTLKGTGYDGDDLDQLIHDLGQTNKPEAPEPQTSRAEELQTQWKVEPLEIWQAGPHRIMCGDATSTTHIQLLMNGNQAEMIWTDPPYGVAVGTKNQYLNTIAPSNRVEENLQNDTLTEAELATMLEAAFINAIKHSTAGAAFYVAAPAGPLHVVFGQILKSLGVWRQTIQWVKNNATFSPLGVDYHWQAEPIFYGWKPDAAHRYYGGRTQTTVWQIDRPTASPEHPTMKPIELMARAIRNNSKRNEIILDMFAGSGSTLIAANQEGRIGYGMEIDAKYVAVTLERLKDAGLTPKRTTQITNYGNQTP